MKSHYEEDLGDFPTFSAEHIPVESMVGSISRRINRSMESCKWNESLRKISPLSDVSTSWFKYEELIDDWLDRTVLEAGKRGPGLKNRLV